MSSDRKTAVAAGVLFLVTEIAAIAGLALYRPLLDGEAETLGAGAATSAFLGALCELTLVAAVIGTGIVLFPVLRRRHEGMALGYACLRLLEAAIITVGILSVLTLVTLRQEATGASATAHATGTAGADRALVALHDWTFLLGPNVALGLNTALLAYVMYRSRLVPRFIAVLGLIGGPLICASAVAVMFGAYEQISVTGSALAVPVFAWEVTLAVRLIAKGFEPARAGSTGAPQAAPVPAEESREALRA
ncbi:DUF4386 domain-containing protein [Streptomyces sp. ISL-66]|uniref:DUF4386 domain-containing protein n=1 Tax=Streptomyces sp. ISL-66 TaxID=2819186 RepID=UPI001BE6B01B|nr:DUF4386 domain-containing protein [Streptomyces sp. ISL-66]MBT2472913.1 DUF4386 domain-containing protein [Streptomyces sp. ISL-66]